ncbi:MAG: hypothetical protein WCF68_13365 [Terriglobales bacterium]
MLVVRTFRPFPLPNFLFLLLVALSILASAQDKDKDKDQDDKSRAPKKENARGSNFVNVTGKVRCEKSEPGYSIAVPDRPGHALMLSKRECMWTEPLVIAGAKTKDGEAVSFIEKMEGTLHIHGFETDTLDNGEKITWQSMGQVLAEKGPVESKGRWSLMRGTGKLKGIKGGGTYEGKLEADDVLTLEFEGMYDPTEMAGQKR